MEDKKFEDFCKSTVPAFFSLVCLIVLFAIMFLFGSCDNKYKRENERLREELARVQQYVPLQRDTIHDSVEIITQKVIEVEKIKEVLSKEDKQLIKDLGIKVRDLEALQKIGMETRNTVFLQAKDSTNNDSTANDTLFYKDAWTDLEYYQRERKLSLKTWDSLAIAMDGIVRKKFLFFRLGVKGYRLKTVNFNPNSTIRSNTFVKKGRK